jgi:hypothetical protein
MSNDNVGSGMREGAGVERKDMGGLSVTVQEMENAGLDFLSVLKRAPQVPEIVTASEKVQSAIILATKGLAACLAIVFLAGCASYIDLGEGRYGVTRVSEERSPFGTNAGFAYLEDCKGKVNKNNWGKLEFTDCNLMTAPQLIYSQGQGGQIVQGVLIGVGTGVAGALVNTGSNVTQGVSQSVTTTIKGGHK